MIGAQIAALHPLPDGAEARFDAFHALLALWNSRMDLTAIPEEEALYRHYLDALTGAALIGHGSRVIDVGTGAGFPGVPLAIARPDLHVTLLDARAKRVAFLQAAVAQIDGLNAEAVHGRAEDYAKAHRESFDCAVSRAVAALPVLLEWTMPLLRVGGQCIFWKGPGIAEELSSAARVAPLLGALSPRVIKAPIAGRDFQHVLVIFDKVKETDARFPRKAGMALKRPL